jgi:hypothetical protein
VLILMVIVVNHTLHQTEIRARHVHQRLHEKLEYDLAVHLPRGVVLRRHFAARRMPVHKLKGHLWAVVLEPELDELQKRQVGVLVVLVLRDLLVEISSEFLNVVRVVPFNTGVHVLDLLWINFRHDRLVSVSST